MGKVRGFRRLMVMVSFATFPGLANLHPVAYTGMEAATLLTPNRAPDAGAKPLRYEKDVDWFTYNRVVVDPVVIYRGPDNQFVGLGENEKRDLAGYMQMRFTKTLATRFEVTNKPDERSTLRIKLILAGAEPSTPFLSTLAWFDFAGGLYNAVQALRGGQSAFTGSVSYAVEVFDASSNNLLFAYVARRYPGALNISATFRTLGAAKAGIDIGAQALLDEIR